MNKAELIRELQEKDQNWQALLDQIGPARMDQPGVNGDWSMKDIVAHLTDWNRWLVDRFQAEDAANLNHSHPGRHTCTRMMKLMPGSMRLSAGAPRAKSWRNPGNNFKSCSPSWKVYLMMSGLNLSNPSSTLCGWAINTFPLASSSIISMMTMSQMYVPG